MLKNKFFWIGVVLVLVLIGAGYYLYVTRIATAAEPVESDELQTAVARIGDLEIGLDPNAHAQGITAPINYWQVDDIHATLQGYLDAGAQVQQAVKSVGGGRLIALVKDTDSNVIGLIQL